MARQFRHFCGLSGVPGQDTILFPQGAERQIAPRLCTQNCQSADVTYAETLAAPANKPGVHEWIFWNGSRLSNRLRNGLIRDLSGGGIGAYVDPASLLIVVGGTLGSVLISDKMQRVILGLKVAGNAFRLPAGDAVKTIETILKLSNIARREGVLALKTSL